MTEAAKRLSAIVAAIEGLIESIDTAHNQGVCRCGESMVNHSSPLTAGHSPVDYWGYLASKAVEEARRAITELDEKVRPNLERFQWLCDNVKEDFVRPETIGSEYPDTRQQYVLPKNMISYTGVGSHLSLAKAVDVERKVFPKDEWGDDED